jgi:hypothetical protein
VILRVALRTSDKSGWPSLEEPTQWNMEPR